MKFCSSDNYSFKKISISLTIIMVTLFLIMIPIPRVDRHLIGCDGPYYYSYMRSFILDGDFNIDNDINLYNSRMPVGDPSRRPTDIYYFSIGPGLLWSPFFVVGHLLNLAVNGLEIPIKTDGYSYIEEAFVCISSILYSLLGLVLIFKLLKQYCSKGIAFFSSLVLYFGTPAFYYALFEPSMSHSLELFTTSLLLYLLIGAKGEKRNWFAIGITMGLVTIVRWQNIIFGLACLLVLYKDTVTEKNKKAATKIFLKKCFIACFGFLPIVFSQMYFWKLTLGSYFLIPQGNGFLNFVNPHILGVLFSTKNGLYLWSPVTLGVFGLYYLKDKKLASILFAIFLIDVYVCSTVQDWWGGAGFGPRRLIGNVPIFALGLALILQRIMESNIKVRFFKVVVIMFVLWTMAFMVQFRMGLIPMNSYLTFDQVVTDKLLLPIKASYIIKNKIGI